MPGALSTATDCQPRAANPAGRYTPVEYGSTIATTCEGPDIALPPMRARGDDPLEPPGCVKAVRLQVPDARVIALQLCRVVRDEVQAGRSRMQIHGPAH